MRSVWSLAVYLSLVLVGGALLSPWVWHGAQTLAASHLLGTSLARQPFHRYVNRSLLALALLGLWPLLRSLRIDSWRSMGVDSPRHHFGAWTRGALIGWSSLGLATLVALSAGARTWNTSPDVSQWLRHASSGLGAAVVVSVLEELLFRGAVFTALRRTWSFGVSAALSSGIYALVHFFQKPVNPDAVHSGTGLIVLGQMLRGFVDLQQLIPGWLNLALAGWILALARERTGRIWFSVGLHAGWIFWLKSYSFATAPNPSADAWIWGTGRLYDGWLAMVFLGLTGILVARSLPARIPPRE